MVRHRCVTPGGKDIHFDELRTGARGYVSNCRECGQRWIFQWIHSPIAGWSLAWMKTLPILKLDGAQSLSMIVVVPMDCEGCGKPMLKGSECQLAGPSDIRMVCMSCFKGVDN